MKTETINQVDLSPTRTAAAYLAQLLPNEEDTATYSGESWHFFHFLTNDYCVMERTVQLACQSNGLRKPFFLPIEEFADCLTSADAKGRKTSYGYELDSAWDHIPALHDGCMLFVWQAFNRVHFDRMDDLKYGQLMLEFLQYCQRERAEQLAYRASGRSGRRELPLGKRVVFVFYGASCPMPELLRDSLRTIRYNSLTEDDFRVLLQEHWQRNQERLLSGKDYAAEILGKREPPKYAPATLKWYANYMSGIPELSVRRLLAEMRWDFPAGNVDFTQFETIEPRIVSHKNETLRQHNRLEVQEQERSGIDKKQRTDVKGLDSVESWLETHKDMMRVKGLAPTGILLVGIPGTGKSATAKMAARIMDLPLVKLDMSKILGGYVGDSEKGMQEMLSDLEYAAPCVLWMDEVEKAMSGADGKSDGSGVMQRLFGMLLTFMQENGKAVFSVTTANDISKLPAEFFRNGRFDQAFCVMMPEYTGCCEIMQDKLAKRMSEIGWLKPGKYDATEMANYAKKVFDACIGTKEDPRFLTGADIEAHVKELFCQYHSEMCACPSADEMAKAMKKIAANLRVQAPASSVTAMRDIASRYLDMLQRGLKMAGSAQTPFTKENLNIDGVRFYKYEEEHAAPPPDCIIHPDPQKQKAALASDRPEDWYDAKFFDCLVKYMNELIIYDRELTPEETRQAYWRMKVGGSAS